MSRYTFRLPDIGEGIAEAEIVAWHVAVGDQVVEDGRLADVMTDKATVEMESPVSGRVVEVAGEVGDRIAIGSALVVIETEDVMAEAPVAAPPPPVAAPAAPAATPVSAPEPVPAPVPATPAAAATPPTGVRVLASPAVRARAKDLGIDLARVQPGAEGRVRHADLDQFIAYNSGGYAPAGGTRADEAIKVIGLRRRIAENMAAAKRHIPHFTYVEEIDVTELERVRAELNTAHAGRAKLTMLLNLWQLAGAITRLADAARNGTIGVGDLSGSTLTVTSLGPLGGVATTPVINRPEVAIIGPNRIIERPMFVPDGMGGERVAKRKLMNLSISCDHRVVDGWDAASFVQMLRRLIETPTLLLVG